MQKRCTLIVNRKIILFLILLNIVGLNFVFAQHTRAQKLREMYVKNDRNNPLNKDRVWIMAHRGVWDETMPESSLGAFERAIDLNFEIIELDVTFSAKYRYEDNQCIKDEKGEHRAIIFNHDVSNERVRGGDKDVGFGLYEYDRNVNNMFSKTEIKGSGGNYNMVMLRSLVPYHQSNSGVIFASNDDSVDRKGAPKLLTIDGKPSSQNLITYNPAVPITKDTNGNIASNDPFNTDMVSFLNMVKGKILINFDKLKDPADFQAVFKLMKSAGLLDQCIFKAKMIPDLKKIYELFGNELKLEDRIIFTPTFTEFDLDMKRNKDFKPLNSKGKKTQDPNEFICINEDERFTKVLQNWNAINVSDASHEAIVKAHFNSTNENAPSLATNNIIRYQKFPIEIAGAEVIFTKDLNDLKKSKDADVGEPTNFFLTKLAHYIFKQNKRVVQFGALPESKKGAWTGGAAKWSPQGKFGKSNFWDFIYDNPALVSVPGFTDVGFETDSKFFADIYVGDRPIEFRAYLNSLKYNMKPIVNP